MTFLTQIPHLDGWVKYEDTLIGRAYNHPEFENGQRVKTNHVIALDVKLGVAKCVADEIWQLGNPGKLSAYVDPVSKRFF